jgi:two-component system cell cycle response regulator DivK
MASKILIVDDNERNLKLLRVLLRSAGYETVEAGDGVRALELSREGPLDLILLDIQMPLMNGIEVLRSLRAEPATSRIPVVALTSYAMKGDRERFLKDGFVGYIAKPLERVSFLEAVREVLGGDRAADAGGASPGAGR